MITAADAHAHGITKSQIEALVRVSSWIRLGRGAYMLSAWLADDGPSTLQRTWSAVLRSGGDPVVAGGGGWELHGLAGAPEVTAIELVMPRAATRHQPGDRRYRWIELETGDVVVRAGLRVLSVPRLLIEASRQVTREVFVSMLDSAVHKRAITSTELRAVRPRLADRASSWVDLADGRCESPLETRVRLIAIDGAVPPDDVNHTVRRGGVPIARVDLAWFRAGLKLGVEVDGVRFHSHPDALYRDRSRQADLTAMGWVVVRVTWWDVVHRPAWILEQIRRHLYSVA